MRGVGSDGIQRQLWGIGTDSIGEDAAKRGAGLPSLGGLAGIYPGAQKE